MLMSNSFDPHTPTRFVLADCAVCEDGYSPTLAYTCSKCSNGEGIAFAAIVLLVVAAAVVVVIFHLVSDNRDETNTRFKRLTKALPVQGFKTVVVAWQILTQVRTPVGWGMATEAWP